MVDSIEDRAFIVRQLREELVGPCPRGEPIDCEQAIRFETKSESYPPRRQLSNGDEILQRTPPTARYGVGVLYPYRTLPDESTEEITPEPGRLEPESDLVNRAATDDIERSASQIGERLARRGGADEEDFDLSTANSYEASSMAVTFLAVLPARGVLQVEVTGGRYRSKEVAIEAKSSQWYLRSSVEICAELPVERLHVQRPTKRKVPIVESENLDGLDLRVEVFARPQLEDGARLLTVSLVNRTPASRDRNELSLFQSHFRASIRAPDDSPCILPYPEAPRWQLDHEEQSLALLYRGVQTYAIGHGCSANWVADQTQSRAHVVTAECLPLCETPSITPEIRRAEGTSVEVSMAALAGLLDHDDGMPALEEIVTLYESWIEDRRKEARALDAHHREAAERNLDQCARCVTRMRNGLHYLENPTVRLAFQLANHAVLLQQISTTANREPRRAEHDAKHNRLAFTRQYSAPDPRKPPDGIGYWRPFQIAFLLMSLRSTVEGDAEDRRTVELIWFPTGGGKTEAYLGLTAFSLFVRRLVDSDDAGVNVLMRYTLRLLTAQQFQRASGLITAMEVLRRERSSSLGTVPFSIGIWLGQNTTPNTCEEARSVLRELEKGTAGAENKMLIRQCPWCGAQMGPLEHKGRWTSNQRTKVLGYELTRKTIVFRCSDEQACPFGQGLPIYVIDEDIYEKRPSLVIGTVDKFAMLAWRPEARTLFGLDEDGNRTCSPPGLVIQDELHLIAGPLGSMVGLFESVIEELCTDKRGGRAIAPKIVSSTATIRRYAEQIRALYARDDVVLFPPPGLDVGDSFFARYARDPGGALLPGRMYLGVNAPGLGSQLTAVVRTFSSLLQSAYDLPAEARDPWWTLLVFFNTLRELGTSLSLFQSDIPDYLVGLRNRTGLEMSDIRFPRSILELTSRLRDAEVPKAIEQLQVKAPSDDPRPLDVCLASSIIEVGIDVDRLSLMAVVSQPKTTSQYIQVTGRVGRRWWQRPGLIVTIYSPTRPRDRSHFEKFRSYHERLYAQVEPTSVTPFSPPALARALHAAMVAYVRQRAAEDLEPHPFPECQADEFVELICRRVEAVEPDEVGTLAQTLAKRLREWQRWEPRKWRAAASDQNPGLMYPAGDFVPPEWKHRTWAVQQSMRTVDAECQGTITGLYLNHDEDGDG